jgi:hypothetical protein
VIAGSAWSIQSMTSLSIPACSRGPLTWRRAYPDDL